MVLFTLCIKIFLVRILDVSLGTLRTVITVKGKTTYASLVGFVEVLIWFVVVKEALSTSEPSLWVAISYALGFAVGTFIGGILSQKIISGNLGVQVVTDGKNDLINVLRTNKYAVTVTNVKGIDDDKFMLFIEINNKQFKHLEKLVKSLDSKAFIVVNETKYVQNGFMNSIVK